MIENLVSRCNNIELIYDECTSRMHTNLIVPSADLTNIIRDENLNYLENLCTMEKVTREI